MELFSDANYDIEKKVAKVVWQIGEGKKITETQKDIITLGKIIAEFSENIRKKI
jgi:hypothetical protein